MKVTITKELIERSVPGNCCECLFTHLIEDLLPEGSVCEVRVRGREHYVEIFPTEHVDRRSFDLGERRSEIGGMIMEFDRIRQIPSQDKSAFTEKYAGAEVELPEDLSDYIEGLNKQ